MVIDRTSTEDRSDTAQCSIGHPLKIALSFLHKKSLYERVAFSTKYTIDL